MSVAEALGQTAISPHEEVRRQRYYPGLNPGSLVGAEEQHHEPKPRVDENHQGMQYGGREYDRGYPHPRPMQDPFTERSNNDVDKMRKQRQDMDEDIRQMKERQMRDKMDREEEKKKNYDLLTKTFPWDQRSQGHGGPRKRETDLFLDTLGGPGGTVLRQNGSPSLTDPRFQQQQQSFQRQGQGDDPKMMEQQKRIEELRKQIDYMKQETGADQPSNPLTLRSEASPNGRLNERRSLDLDNTRGGAGAPIKDFRGKNVTRRPITLSRDDYGESKIKEDIPGKGSFDFNFIEEDTRPYHPWGGQGGGAPIRDRDGRVVTNIYGNFETKSSPEADFRRNKRRQEVLYNELKEGMRQQKENKEELTRYMKAPQAELADVLLAGRVGKPKRDEITGEIGQQHLGNSDVSKLKMNYQPKPVSQKKQYHDELLRMAEERQHQKQLEKLKERQESNAHFQNMDQTWGLFGGGAPKHEQIRKKANLTNSLFYPDQSPERQHVMEHDMPPTGLGSFAYQSPTTHSYHKLFTENDQRRFASPDNSPRFVKSTINSSHKNMFDTSSEQRLRTNAPAMAPYATGGMY